MRPTKLDRVLIWRLSGGSFWILFVWVFFGFGCSPEETPQQLNVESCSHVVVGTDYSSTSVSLLDGEGELCAANFLHSGSALPGLVTALSGDVVLPNSKHPEGFISLIDRFPNGVITLVDPSTALVHSQFSVGDSFAPNPQDILFWSASRAYVPRHERNPSPTPEPEDWDEGDDILIVNPENGNPLGRIALETELPSNPDGPAWLARPSRMVSSGKYAWVALRCLSADFRDGGDGVLVSVDSETDEVSQRLDLAGFKNCGGLSADPGGRGFWGSCTGIFDHGAEQQAKESGLFFVRTSDGSTGSLSTVGAEILGTGALSFDVEALDEDRVVYIALGDLMSGIPDELYLYDSSQGNSLRLHISAPPYQLGGIHWQSDRGLLLVANANPIAPMLLRATLDGLGAVSALDPVDTSPGIGLPPRFVGAFR